MKRNILAPSLASLLAFTLLPSAFGQPPQQPQREIMQVRGDLYRLRERHSPDGLPRHVRGDYPGGPN